MTTKATKWISESRCVWDNGKRGDQRVALWADKDNVHVWAETNDGDDEVYGEELRALLVAEGVSLSAADKAVLGDLSGLRAMTTRFQP